MKTNKYYLLFAATLLVLTSCGNGKGDYDASGTFEATEVIVSAEGNGKLLQFNVEEGMRLKAGKEVGYIDTLHIIYKEGLSFGCKDTGICANSRSCLLIFRFECFISIIIKENSYFCYFFRWSFFIDNFLFYNLFRRIYWSF